MKDLTLILPASYIDSSAVLASKDYYFDVQTGTQVNTQHIEAAITLGLDIYPKFKRNSEVVIKLKIRSSEIIFSINEFKLFIKLVDNLIDETKFMSEEEAVLLTKFPYQIGKTITKKLKEPLNVTLPDGEVMVIPDKVAKYVSLSSLIPSKYFIVTATINKILSYSVSYISKSKSLKVGCNSIKINDLYEYFDKILSAWKDLDEELNS